MSYKLRSDELDSGRVTQLTSNPEMQNYLLSLQEDLRGLITYVKELEQRIETLESA